MIRHVCAGVVTGIASAARSFRLTPGTGSALAFVFALTLVVTGLAFAVYEAVVLRPLPFEDPEAFLVRVYPQRPDATTWKWPSGRDYTALKDRLRDLRVAAVSRAGRAGVQAPGQSLSVMKADTSARFFDLLRVRLTCGTPVVDRSVVLTARLASDLFAEASAACGQTVFVDSAQYPVAGVLPADFRWQYSGEDFHVWRMVTDAEIEQARQLDVIVAPPAGGTLRAEAVNAQIGSIVVESVGPGREPAILRGLPLRSVLLDDNPKVVTTLMTIIFVAAFMGVANISAMFLSRARQRFRQTALRAALGAPASRLRGEIAGEALAYCMVGAFAAAPVVAWLLPVIADYVQGVVPSLRPLSVNWRVMMFLMLGGTSAAVIASGPAMVLSGTASDYSLRDDLQSGSQRESRDFRGVSHGILILQFALVTALATIAVVAAVSVLRLSRIQLGFDPSDVVSYALRPKGPQYTGVEGSARYYEQVLQRVRGVSAVAGAAMATGFPLGGVDPKMKVGLDEAGVLAGGGSSSVVRAVDRNYFSVMGIAIIAGETLPDAVTSRPDPMPVVVNQALATQLWPAERPLGRRLAIGEPMSAGRISLREAYVVGVSRNTVTRGLASAPMEVYVPLRASPLLSATLLVKVTRTNPEALREISRQVLAVDSTQFIAYGDPRRVARNVDDVLQRPRLYAVTTSLLAAGVIVLAMYGVYSLLSYWMTLRRKELAIMSSLGAPTTHLVRYSAAGTSASASIGLAIGALASRSLVPMTASNLEFASKYSGGVQLAVVAGLLLLVMATTAVQVLRQRRMSPADILRMP